VALRGIYPLVVLALLLLCICTNSPAHAWSMKLTTERRDTQLALLMLGSISWPATIGQETRLPSLAPVPLLRSTPFLLQLPRDKYYSARAPANDEEHVLRVCSHRISWSAMSNQETMLLGLAFVLMPESTSYFAYQRVCVACYKQHRETRLQTQLTFAKERVQIHPSLDGLSWTHHLSIDRCH